MVSGCYIGKISRFARNDRFLRLFTISSSLGLSKMDKQTKEKGFETASTKVQISVKFTMWYLHADAVCDNR